MKRKHFLTEKHYKSKKQQQQQQQEVEGWEEMQKMYCLELSGCNLILL